jgi:hypothetical protein
MDTDLACTERRHRDGKRSALDKWDEFSQHDFCSFGCILQAQNRARLMVVRSLPLTSR